jgi:hypothetical protein
MQRWRTSLQLTGPNASALADIGWAGGGLSKPAKLKGNPVWLPGLSDHAVFLFLLRRLR